MATSQKVRYTKYDKEGHRYKKDLMPLFLPLPTPHALAPTPARAQLVNRARTRWQESEELVGSGPTARHGGYPGPQDADQDRHHTGEREDSDETLPKHTHAP